MVPLQLAPRQSWFVVFTKKGAEGTGKNFPELKPLHENGKDLGVVWTAPWQVEITEAVKEGENQMEIEVANLWPNRLIGDAALPKDKRINQTNIITYNTPLQKTEIPDSGWAQGKCADCKECIKSGAAPELLPSGLLGPVRLKMIPHVNE